MVPPAGPLPPDLPEGFEAGAFRVLLENLPGVVYRCRNDETWSMMFISPYVEALTGHPPEAFLDGRVSFGSLIHPEDRERVWGTIQGSLAARLPFRLSYRLQRSDGSYRWVREDGRGDFNDQGTLRWLDGVVLDYTEQIEAERALRATEENLRMALRASQMGVWRWERGGHAFLRTDKVDQLFGFPVGAKGLRLRDFLDRVDPADLARINALTAETSSLEVELTIRPEGLAPRRAHIFTRLLKDDQGIVHVAMGTLRAVREGE
ncbi:MAG: PAS domain-containing protein [Acidobacteria bacterium]|nr:PAS domain-containing protein [Acidobacteriota bacterium]